MLQPEHEAELNSFPRTPVMKIIYALGMLADVVDADMVRKERDVHFVARHRFSPQVVTSVEPRHGRQGDYHYRLGGNDEDRSVASFNCKFALAGSKEAWMNTTHLSFGSSDVTRTGESNGILQP